LWQLEPTENLTLNVCDTYIYIYIYNLFIYFYIFLQAGYTTPILIVGATGGEALAKAQAVSSENNSSTNGIVGIIGGLVNPFIASILVASGTTGILTALFGEPSLAGISRMVYN
jgi:hypothetical protein